ncbi:hypothetical protein, partial [Pectobacterium atrosepticum]|uniref:hypothetical protein n=1 Tax=Pectobacterium atrosepticum TaxID=29471 RepID=UPI00301A69DE
QTCGKPLSKDGGFLLWGIWGAGICFLPYVVRYVMSSANSKDHHNGDAGESLRRYAGLLF